MSTFAEDVTRDLKCLLPSLRIFSNTSWKNLTTMKIGSSSPIVCEPESDIELAQIVKYCNEEAVQYMVLGCGSNILGTDKDVPRLVIRLKNDNFHKLKQSHVHVNTTSGLFLYDFLARCAKAGLGGAAPLAGIPGSIGGAIRMNASAKGVSVSDFVESVCGVDSQGEIWTASVPELKWGYRHSSIPEDLIITAAIWKLNPVDDPNNELRLIQKELVWRRKNTPVGRSAGCVFRNPDSTVSSGKIIDKCGLKGFSFGGAAVSEMHANYFMNQGNATEEDMLSLMIDVRRKVFADTGIILEPEIAFVNPESHFRFKESIQTPKLALLKGGSSSEREISLKSASYVAPALAKAGYSVEEIDLREPVIADGMRRADIVFSVLHGGFGENGSIQRLMEQSGIEFIGTGTEASSLCMDKVRSKEMMLQRGIPTPPFAVIDKNSRKFPTNLWMPLIVKPPDEGSTVGISLVESLSDWEPALEKVFSIGSKTALVEKYIQGVELTVGVIGGKPLPPVEIIYPGKMYDYDAKYTHLSGETKYICPPTSITESDSLRAQDIAVKFYNAIGARDMLRVDMILSKLDSKLYVLEGNSIPGFTDSSLLPKAAMAAGTSFVELCAKLANYAFSRRKK